MSTPPLAPPSGARLVKATAVAAAVAAVLLITIVLPAEYGVDPTGVGGALGLNVLAEADESTPAAVAPQPAAPSTNTDRADTALEARAVAAFGRDPGQAFDAGAVSERAGTLREHEFIVELQPGKGAEVKARLAAGEGLVYAWSATGDVALDMHGEAPDANGTWTTYAAAPSQRAASGTFIAPFDGAHGWYWKNEGDVPVSVTIKTIGFQPGLYRP